jgi:hypothetical protein
MKTRNTSPHQMFYETALEHEPVFRFRGSSQAEFEEWQARAKPEVMKTLGRFPERVPLDPELWNEWEHDGVIKQKWIINVQRHLSVTFLLAYPKSIKPRERLPTIMCWHGHSKFGKETVMGNDSSDEHKAEIKTYNCDYGHQMARAGFATFAIDWIGRGDLDDEHFHQKNLAVGRDWCNLYYLAATMFGWTSLSVILTHARAAVDFAATLPPVDINRLGVMGLSGGGTMTTWTALSEERIKAAEIICYADLWPAFAYKRYNVCGMQVAPGLFNLVDVPDLQGLIAPKPLLFDIGVYDTCFHYETAVACYRQVERIYKAAAAADRLHLDCFPDGHKWGGNKSVEFFAKYL